MNINKAIQIAAEQGLLLFTEDSHKDRNGHERENLICHAYVKPILDLTAQPTRLCSWSELYHMSTADYLTRLAALPREAGVA